MLFVSWLRGSWLGLGLVGVWVALIADEWLRGLFMLQRWRGRGWLKHAHRARAQAASSPALAALQSRSFT